MTASSGESNSLLALSNQLADIVEQVGDTIVVVNGRRRRAASGVHWKPGILVTTDHAVSRDEEITITLPDGQTDTATLVGRDPGTDLAVLKLTTGDFPTPTFGNGTTLKVGHMVLAIARSGDSGITASLGVISALAGGWRTWQGGRIDQFIRPSLMLYPGFSGGALVDVEGRIVGINTVGPRHMALTIPTATVNRVVEQLLQGGRMARGYLGLGMQPVELPETLRRSLHLSEAGGVIVVSVEPTGPAEQAGVLIGDILITLAGTPISDVGDVHALLDSDSVGQTLPARMIRGGSLVELAITIGDRPNREV